MISRAIIFIAFFLLGSAHGADATAPASPLQFVKMWGERGDAPGQFDMPIAIATNAADEVYVTDHYNDRIQRFDADGNLLGCYPSLPNPGGIAIDAAGQLYVTHFAATAPDFKKPNAVVCVAVYSSEAKLLRQWGKQGAGDGEFNSPAGVALRKDGRVYVADQTNHRVQTFDTEGKFLFKWGHYGNETGQFGGGDSEPSRTGGPQFIALDAEGNVWTTESMGCRIQKFTPDGQFLSAWGDKEDAPGHLGGFFAWPDGNKGRLQGPIALCFDVQGRLWISACSGRVQCFTQDGKFVCGIGDKQGSVAGEFNVPHGVAVDTKGALYVVDSMNHRIQKFH